MNKKEKFYFFILAILIGTLVGCSSPKEEIKAEKTPGETEGVTITMMAPSGELYKIDRVLMKAYEDYSGNRVDFQEIPDDQYANVLKAKLASGMGPDIAVIWPKYNAAQFFPQKSFVNLSDQQWIKEESNEAIDNQGFAGQIIGLGFDGGNSGWGILYNKKIFTQYGLKVPETTQEFMELCEVLKQEGITPLAGSLKESWTSGVWLALMGPLVDKLQEGYYEKLNQNKAKFQESQVFLQFIKEYKQIYDLGYLGDDALTSTARDAFIQVLEGSAAMALSNATPEVWVADSGMTVNMEDYGMFPAPYVDNKMLARYEGGFIRVINKKSENIEACKDYFNFLTNRENIILYYSSPERRTIAPAFKQTLEQFKLGSPEQELMENSNGETRLIAESGLKYWDNTVYGQLITQAVMGEISPEMALESIDRYREKMFESEQ